MKWLEIKKNPPTQDYEWSLVCDKNYPDETSISASYSLERKEFYNLFNGVYLALEDITHWMPTPTYNEVRGK